MTHRYFVVRKALYEMNIRKSLVTTREFSDMRKLYKWAEWVMRITLFALIAIVLFIFGKLSMGWSQPFVISGFLVLGLFIFIGILQEIIREKNRYNMEQRNIELQESEETYNQYISRVQEIFEQQGIITLNQYALLKKEAEERLLDFETRFKVGKVNLVNALIYAPITIFVTVCITNMDIEQSNSFFILLVILNLALVLLILFSFIKRISFYFTGTFKDKYFLDILKDIEYSNFFINRSSNSRLS